MKSIIVLGGNGQLGQCLKKASASLDLKITFFSSKELDISNFKKLKTVFHCHQPDVVINCAAYTMVDRAEGDGEKARLVNSTAVGYIAEACKEVDALLIHISTDFVFEGNQAHPLKETDNTSPLSVYGKTKLAGEKEITATLKSHIILRTSWLYSEFGTNFVNKMLQLGKEKESLEIVVDQIGTPTYGMDLADAILKISLSHSPAYGVYHYSNEGLASWFDFAHAIFKISGVNVEVFPVLSDQFPTKAKRPPFSVLDKTKIKEGFSLKIPHWRDSLERCLKVMN